MQLSWPSRRLPRELAPAFGDHSLDLVLLERIVYRSIETCLEQYYRYVETVEIFLIQYGG